MSSSPKKVIDNYRLPTDVRPTHYDLTIRTDLEKEKFAGFVKIECARCHLYYIPCSPVASLEIVNATKVITFNAVFELSLRQATLVIASSNVELQPVGTKVELDTQRTSLIFADELPAGTKATLRIGYDGTLTDSMTGYYKSTWEKGTYALTQFEVRE
jgi:aminopeptidase 2